MQGLSVVIVGGGAGLGALIGRMRIEAGRVSTGSVTPLDLGRAAW